MKFRTAACALIVGAVLACVGCSGVADTTAIVWTDSPSLALYAATFNESQSRYKIEVQYRADIAASLERDANHPALVVGKYLKNSDYRRFFQPVDYLFGELVINRSAFYPGLLAQGNVDGRQLILPVSFDIPLILFRADGPKPGKDGFIVTFDELRAAAKSFNELRNGSFVRMGFSIRWHGELLAAAARMFGADIRDGNPFQWKDDGLDRTIAYVRTWSADNRSAADEEEFQFKYLYVPPYKSLEDGRIMFAYVDSAQYFVIPEQTRMAFDYRWLAHESAIPVDEDYVSAAVCRNGRGKQAAEAFLKWLFKEDTQKALLERAKKLRVDEGTFGIAGGFSSIKSVNEKVFPMFYPSLLSHIPPEKYIRAPGPLPTVWPDIKARVIVPFLLDATGANPPSDTREDFRKRVDQWAKQRGG